MLPQDIGSLIEDSMFTADDWTDRSGLAIQSTTVKHSRPDFTEIIF